MRLYEKKDNLIKKNPNLTEEQKQEIINLLARHPSYESKIDWNRNSKLTYEDFLNVLRPLYINDLDFRGLVKGEDYDLLLDKPKEKLYFIHTYNASKIIASNSVEPKLWTEIPDWCGYEEKIDEAHAFGHFDSEHGDMKPGAKWCISMQTSNELWNDYSKKFYFVFWIRNNSRLKSSQKIAICIDKKDGKIAEKFSASDNELSLNLPVYLQDIINGSIKNVKEKRKQQFLSKCKLNPETNRYDYKGSLSSGQLGDLVSEDGNGFIINFGEIDGSFECNSLELVSLKGAPQRVGGNFWCFNNKLTSLEGAPQEVGVWCLCFKNNLTSLEGAPKKVLGGFDCSRNQLTSLKGAPQEVGGDFFCSENPNLHSLDGIGEVKGDIFKDF